MTAFRVQNLFLPDCESRILEEYYGWGREKGKKKSDWVEPDWSDASPELRHSVALRGYALFDGCPVSTVDYVTVADVWVTAGFNSRVTSFDVVRFLARNQQGEPYLKALPRSASLERATDEQLVALDELISLYRSPFVGLGKITKVLHKKRPRLVPVLDNVLYDFLWKNFPHRLRQNSPVKEYLEMLQEILRAYWSPVKSVQGALDHIGLYLTPVRTLDFVLWCGWRERVDAFGFGKPLTKVWEVSSIAEARRKAAATWEERG